MGIEIRQPGEAELYGKAAILAGKAEKAKREEAYAVKVQENLRQMNFEREMRQMAYDVELERAKRNQMIQLEKESRAQTWELEKMETASRIDFEREERERQRELGEIDNARMAIKKKVDAGQISPKQVESVLFNLDMREMGVTGVGGLRQEKPIKEDVLSPTQLLSAQKKIEQIEAEKPGFLKRLLPEKWEGGPSEEQTQIQEYLQGQVSRTLAQEIPTGTISTGLPIVKNDADYDALLSGAEFIDPDGNKRRKP